METASRVFVKIGLACSIVLLVLTLLSRNVEFLYVLNEHFLYYLLYSIYSILTSIWCLIALNGESKAHIVAAGIFYIPVVLLASIFMFCIKEEDLYEDDEEDSIEDLLNK